MSSPNKSPDHDLVSQKVGRNLLLFQKTEHVLKSMLEIGQISATSDGWIFPEATIQTFGQTFSLFREKHIMAKEPAGIRTNDGWGIALGFSIDAVDLEETLGQMISDRNRLVHHFFQDFDLETEHGCGTACTVLDDQHNQYHPVLTRLRDYHRELREDFRELCESLRDPGVTLSWFLPEIRESILIKRFVTLSPTLSSADGWTSLAGACSIIQQESPSLISETMQRWEIKSVSQLLMASECFELKTEPTPMGGTRILYRTLP